MCQEAARCDFTLLLSLQMVMGLFVILLVKKGGVYLTINLQGYVRLSVHGFVAIFRGKHLQIFRFSSVTLDPGVRPTKVSVL